MMPPKLELRVFDQHAGESERTDYAGAAIQAFTSANRMLVRLTDPATGAWHEMECVVRDVQLSGHAGDDAIEFAMELHATDAPITRGDRGSA